jgi:hypothetical protein
MKSSSSQAQLTKCFSISQGIFINKITHTTKTTTIERVPSQLVRSTKVKRTSPSTHKNMVKARGKGNKMLVESIPLI